MIHRKRKRKRDVADDNRVSPDGLSPKLQSHLTADIEVTQERLQWSSLTGHDSLGALSSLDDACAAVWHDGLGRNKSAKEFFYFEEHAVEWVDSAFIPVSSLAT